MDVVRMQEPAVLQVCRGSQRAEVWTDILLAYLPLDSDTANSLGFDVSRMDKFRANIASLEPQGKLTAFSHKLLRDVAAYFRQYPPQTSGNEDLNGQLLGSIQAALGQKVGSQPTLAGRAI